MTIGQGLTMQKQRFLWLFIALLITFSPQLAHVAKAERGLELGGFLGGHIFSDNNELGVADISTADSISNSLAVGARLGYALLWLASVEAELVLIPSDARVGTASVNTLGWRLHGLVHLAKQDAKIRPFLLAGFGGLSAFSSDNDVIDDDTDFMFHGGVGVKLAATDTWGVRVDGRILLPPSSSDKSVTDDWEVFVGLYKFFGPSQPKPPADTDGDGIVDENDKCPNDAEDPDGFEDRDGCPDVDNDGDGIDDANDKCPDEPESKNGIDDEDGCPENDPDNDGLSGSADQCPNEPEDMDKFEDENGCPDLDNDGDGLDDKTDQCPNKAETVNGYEDSDGCPDEVPEKVAKFSGTIKGIKFKLGSAVLTRSSYKVLDEAVKVLAEYQTVRLEIQGHTDSTGSDENNLNLSERRAASVRQYLTSKGVADDRLESKGYGETTPIADNNTPQGRAQNRRVEFKLLSN